MNLGQLYDKIAYNLSHGYQKMSDTFWALDAESTFLVILCVAITFMAFVHVSNMPDKQPFKPRKKKGPPAAGWRASAACATLVESMNEASDLTELKVLYQDAIHSWPEWKRSLDTIFKQNSKRIKRT